ncbi:MAG: adenylate/guanylate cyclase domain-containing protein [Coleofasciculus sp. G3-WIS-01]|uniref:CHASE2 domain-containing protein n=1 Tax=Coleofasciculus sp. G3-WIS-01 TaxID=3069528 RepID=UPI00330332EC
MTNLKKWLWQGRGIWITAPSVTVCVILFRMLGLLQLWEWAAYDQYMRLRSPEPQDQRIAIVGIDERDIQSLGQPILADGVYAKLIRKLKARQPRVIGLDIFRDIPIEPGHDQLVKVFESTPNLVGIEKVVGETKREIVAPPPALKVRGQVGANDLIVDADNKVRRGLISVDKPTGETVYSFSLHLALRYLKTEGIQPEMIPGSQNWKLGETIFRRFQPNDGGYVRADAGGYQILVNYRGGAKHFEVVSLKDVLNHRLPPDWGRDRIILIGVVGDSFPDFFTTPYSSGLFSGVKPMAGVEVHANLTSQIISAAMDGRPLMRTVSDVAEGVWIFLWAGIGAVLTWFWRHTGCLSQKSYHRRVGQVFAAGILLGITYLAFLYGWWLTIVPPLMAFTGSCVAITAYIAHTAAAIQRTFGRYLSPEVVVNLLENQDGLKLGGKRQKVTILTADLRGFTALSEKILPEDVVNILNLYLASMLEVILSYQGTIDKFMGDGILVIFGAPTMREDDGERAVACAVAMQLTMSRVNAKMEELGWFPLDMGIGINTGEAVVGNIGSEKHSEYTVIGNQVNLAFRIESCAIGNQVLISESTLQEVGAFRLTINGSQRVQPKGVQQPITIYEIGGIGEPYNLVLSQHKDVFCSLRHPIPIIYTLLDGKTLTSAIFRGKMIKLSNQGAEICIRSQDEPFIPPPLSDIKINLININIDDRRTISEDIYAKVLEWSETAGSFYIHFTFIPTTVTGILSSSVE